ncbi:hypothetical protein [Rhizobium lentis]|uniref:hypothetical protein n=1 Tax=Rhizobium lentis TaxID=1138194 RepID=UPI002180D37E|nr:hypothetical protein [Rhizobium lentis]
MGFIFGGDTGQTQADVTDARKRLAAAMLQQGTDTSPIQSPWEGAARMAQALMGGLAVRNQANQQRTADAQVIAAITGQPYSPPEQPKGFLSSLFGGDRPANPGASGSSMPKVDASGNIAATPTSSELPSSFLAAVDRTEGAGDYDTLFGHAQKDGPFAGTSVSSMPIRDVIAFTDPSGPYAQYVKGKVGHVATPVGKYQTVGTTIRGAVGALGLDPNAPYDRATQDRVASYLARQRIASADTLPGKIQALRAEWQGFKNVPDTEMAQIVADLESGAAAAPAGTQVASAGPVAPPAAPIQPLPVNPLAPPQTPAVAPGEVASLDPSVGIPMPGAAGQMRASDPAQVMPPQSAPQAALPPLPTSTVGPTPPVASVPTVDQKQPAPVRLAQALDNAPQQAPNPMANPRAQALVQAIMNPNASPQVKAMAAQQLQILTRPPEYGFQTLPDGAVLRSDPRTGTVAPIYQATPKPVEVNGRLVDPVSGKVIADYSNRQVSTVDGTVIDNTTGEPVYQSHKPMDVNGRLVDPVTGQQIADYSNPNVSDVDGALVDQRTGKVIYQGKPKGMAIQPGEAVINPQTGEVLHQGTGYKPEDVSNLRKEIQNLSTYKSYQQALPSYSSMIDTAKTDSKASDLNLIYGLGKIMDPNSVVREGEMAMVQNTSSWPDWLKGAYDSVTGGSRLEPDTRKAILGEARSRMMAYRGALDNDISQYRGIIGRRGMNEADILPTLGDIAAVPDLVQPPPATGAAPPVQPPAQAPVQAPSPQQQGTPRPRATNPQTGEVIEFDGKQWVPVK